MSAVQRLPPSITGVALSFLPMQDLLNATRVSKGFQSAVHAAFARTITEISNSYNYDDNPLKQAILHCRVSFPAAEGFEIFKSLWRYQLNAARDTRDGYLIMRREGTLSEYRPVRALQQMLRIHQLRQVHRDNELLEFCNSTLFSTGHVYANITIPGQTWDEKRAWLNNPANEADLARYKNLHVTASSLPPEICRFTRCESLRVRSPDDVAMVHVPRQLAALRNLSEVCLDDCNFREVPAVFSELPSLSTLIIDNQERWVPALNNHVTTPIRELPDEIARKTQAASFGTFCKRAFYLSVGGDYLLQFGRKHAFSNNHYTFPWYMNLHAFSNNHYTFPWYMNLPEEELNDIPFFIWFRDNVSLPHVSLCGILDGLYDLLFRNSSIALLVYSCLIVAPLCLLLALAALFYNTLIFPINLFMNYAVEPIVTFVRDQLGYSRMVHIRDLPPAALKKV